MPEKWLSGSVVRCGVSACRQLRLKLPRGCRHASPRCCPHKLSPYADPRISLVVSLQNFKNFKSAGHVAGLVLSVYVACVWRELWRTSGTSCWSVTRLRTCARDQRRLAKHLHAHPIGWRPQFSAHHWCIHARTHARACVLPPLTAHYGRPTQHSLHEASAGHLPLRWRRPPAGTIVRQSRGDVLLTPQHPPPRFHGTQNMQQVLTAGTRAGAEGGTTCAAGANTREHA